MQSASQHRQPTTCEAVGPACVESSQASDQAGGTATAAACATLHTAGDVAMQPVAEPVAASAEDVVNGATQQALAQHAGCDPCAAIRTTAEAMPSACTHVAQQQQQQQQQSAQESHQPHAGDQGAGGSAPAAGATLQPPCHTGRPSPAPPGDPAQPANPATGAQHQRRGSSWLPPPDQHTPRPAWHHPHAALPPPPLPPSLQQHAQRHGTMASPASNGLRAASQPQQQRTASQPPPQPQQQQQQQSARAAWLSARPPDSEPDSSQLSQQRQRVQQQQRVMPAPNFVPHHARPSPGPPLPPQPPRSTGSGSSLALSAAGVAPHCTSLAGRGLQQQQQQQQHQHAPNGLLSHTGRQQQQHQQQRHQQQHQQQAGQGYGMQPLHQPRHPQQPQPRPQQWRPQLPGAAAGSSRPPWGWWRQAGSRGLLGLDPVRLPLLQLHAAAHSQHASSGGGDTSSGSEALLQRLCPAEAAAAAAAAAQQQLPSVGSGGSSLARARCWRQLLAVGADRQRTQLLAGPHSAGQHDQQQPSQQQQQQPGITPRLPLPQGGSGAPPGEGAPPAAIVPPGSHTSSGHAAAAAAAAGAPVLDPARAGAAAAAGAAAGGGGAPGVGLPQAAKPAKRPWQPKLLPDEPNWDKAAFAAVQARLEQSAAKGGGSKLPRALPEHSTATFAMLMLLHSAGWPNHLLWEHWQAAHPPGSLAMFVHMKAGVSLGLGMPGRDTISRCKLKASVDARWGDISLVQAQLESLAEVLRRCPKLTHIGLASGHDIPVQLIRPGLLLPGVSLFGAYQFGPTETRTLKVAVVDTLAADTSMTEEEAQAWGRALTFHHQWMVLSREHAAALVQHSREIVMIGRLLHKACCSVRAGMAPDEFIIVTALRQHGLIRSVQRVEVKPGMRYPPGSLLNSYPTFVVFPAETSPHPVLWTNTDDTVECQVDDHQGGEQQRRKRLSLANCLDYCVARSAIFFRKVEIRQTRGEELVLLLSSLEEMWQGRRRVDARLTGGATSGKSTPTNSSGTCSGRKGNGKRKKQSTLQSSGMARMAQSVDTSPASSAAAISDAAVDAGEEQEQKKPKVVPSAVQMTV